MATPLSEANLQTMARAVIDKRNAERPFRDGHAVDHCGGDTAFDAIRIFDRDFIPAEAWRSVISNPFHARGIHGLKSRTSPCSRRPSMLSSPARCIHPAEPVYQVPAAAADMRRYGVDVGRRDVRFHFVAVHIGARSGMI